VVRELGRVPASNWTIAHPFQNMFGSMVHAVPLRDVIPV
jgi:hypothetical protein